MSRMSRVTNRRPITVRAAWTSAGMGCRCSPLRGSDSGSLGECSRINAARTSITAAWSLLESRGDTLQGIDAADAHVEPLVAELRNCLGVTVGHQRFARSEERRVGKECRSRWSPDHYKKKTRTI